MTERADRPVLLSTQRLEVVAARPPEPTGRQSMAAELLLAREVIKKTEVGEMWSTAVKGWRHRSGGRVHGVPLSEARPDLAAYLDALEALNDDDE